MSSCTETAVGFSCGEGPREAPWLWPRTRREREVFCSATGRAASCRLAQHCTAAGKLHAVQNRFLKNFSATDFLFQYHTPKFPLPHDTYDGWVNVYSTVEKSISEPCIIRMPFGDGLSFPISQIPSL